MKKNTLLNMAIGSCKFMKIIYILAFVMLTGIFIHLQINRSAYEKVTLNDSHDNAWFKIETRYGDKVKNIENFTVGKLTTGTLYFTFIKYSLVLFFSFLGIKEFQKVMESVKGIKTFQENNVESFRKIGKYLFIIFMATIYSNHSFSDGVGVRGFCISPTLLVLSLLAYIIAEIFKEGNNLEEENKLTV